MTVGVAIRNKNGRYLIASDRRAFYQASYEKYTIDEKFGLLGKNKDIVMLFAGGVNVGNIIKNLPEKTLPLRQEETNDLTYFSNKLVPFFISKIAKRFDDLTYIQEAKDDSKHNYMFESELLFLVGDTVILADHSMDFMKSTQDIVGIGSGATAVISILDYIKKQDPKRNFTRKDILSALRVTADRDVSIGPPWDILEQTPQGKFKHFVYKT